MTQREQRITELRDYAQKHYNEILQRAEREIKAQGWVPHPNPNFVPEVWNQPSLDRRGMSYRRPWADFLLIMIDRAQEDYYVSEETAKSYARIALRPFERELLGCKYQTTDPNRKWLTG